MISRHRFQIALSVLFVFLFYIGFPFYNNYYFPHIKQASADNGYIDPNGNGTVGADWLSTGSFYTEIDEGTRQPNTPTTSDYISHLNNKTDTAFLRMSTVSSVSSVSEIVVWIYHNDSSNGQFHAQLYDDDESTTRSSESSFTSSSTNAWHSVTFSSLSLTQAQLDSLSIRLRNSKPGGGGPATNYIYAIYAYVTYTPTASISISLTTDGSVAFGGTPLDTSKDTTTSGINDVEVVSIDSGPADIDIRSTYFSDGGSTWPLGASNGSDIVQWEFSKTGSSWTTMAVVDQLYAHDTNVAQGTTSPVYFRITIPTSSSSYNQYSTTVTIVASTP